MKYLILTAIILLCFISCKSGLVDKSYNNFKFGKYIDKQNSEILDLKIDSTFTISEFYGDSDVVVPYCKQYLATGSWSFKKNNLFLTNTKNLSEIDYFVKEGVKGSKDSIYINIKIPNEDAFFKGKFQFQLKVKGGPNFYSNDGDFSIPQYNFLLKNKDFSLMIQDLYPKVKKNKCYHRIYFIVFEEYRTKNQESNFFTIELKNFNQCFVESFVLENEILFIDDNERIYWDEKVFGRVSN